MRRQASAANASGPSDNGPMIGIPIEQRITDLARRDCGAEQKTLAVLAAQRAQDINLFLCLDALGQRHETQAMPYIDCGPDQFLRPWLHSKILGERAVDLDLVNRKTVEIAQPRISGAEVIQGNHYAKLFQALQDIECFRGFFQQERLGDLELKPVSGKTMFFQRGGDDINQFAGLELGGRYIYCNRELLLQGTCQLTGLFQHPVSNGDDHAA